MGPELYKNVWGAGDAANRWYFYRWRFCFTDYDEFIPLIYALFEGIQSRIHNYEGPTTRLPTTVLLKTCLAIEVSLEKHWERVIHRLRKRKEGVESLLESLFFKNQLVIFLPRKQTLSAEIIVCLSVWSLTSLQRQKVLQ